MKVKLGYPKDRLRLNLSVSVTICKMVYLICQYSVKQCLSEITEKNGGYCSDKQAIHSSTNLQYGC